MSTINPEVCKAINNIAGKYGHLAEDVAAHVTLKFLEHAAEDKTFAKQKPGYQRQWCKWTAAKFYRELATYNNYVSGEDEVCALSLEGDEVYFDEYASSRETTPEKMYIWQETQAAVKDALFQLPVTYERVARLLIDGYEPDEIAYKLAMSPSHVSHTIARMQAKMRQLQVL